MARTISQRELRNDSGAILRAAEAGETFVVTRNGVPIAELRPLRRRQFVPGAEILEAWKHLPKIDFTQFREDIDRYIDPYVP